MHEIVVALNEVEYDQFTVLLALLRQNSTSITDETINRSIFVYGIGALLNLIQQLEQGDYLRSSVRLIPDPQDN